MGGNSPETHWLGLHTFTAEGVGSIPGSGTTSPQATHTAIKRKEKKNGVSGTRGQQSGGAGLVSPSLR